jgi:predicted GNAT superfamily acetyltransferase
MTEPDGAARAAAAVARGLAERQGLAVRELVAPQDHLRLIEVFDAIWGRAEEQVLSPELLRVVAFECGYLSGAAIAGGPDGGDDLVAASIGLFGVTPEGETILHSHITGALPAGRSRHAGFVLKQHQRAWALVRGLSTVQWTFDPLVRRNAYFNAVKLAALPVGYVHDFYGEMTDAINAGHHSDRLVVRWPLRAPDAVAAASGTAATCTAPEGTTVLLAEDADGRPAVPGAGAAAGPDGAPAVLVGTPADVERLRADDPEAARSWRAAHRDVLPGLLGSGWRVTGFVDRHSYLLLPPGDPRPPPGPQPPTDAGGPR